MKLCGKQTNLNKLQYVLYSYINGMLLKNAMVAMMIKGALNFE